MEFSRASGILLHPTSLPSRFGIGDLGSSAYQFIDFLNASGQTLWQILPLGPTGYEHSPYTMNFSAFAGNPLMIDLDALATEGLLEAQSLEPLDIPPERVRFSRVIPHKMRYLQEACDRFSPTPEFEKFCQEQASWLNDYVLFMALLEANDGKDWHTWDRAIARREPEALQAQAETLKDRIAFHQFIQFKFFEQWMKLRAYANERQIQIIGDISIYVCHNSSDVWANPDIFQLDPETLAPAYIAGVPPDYFSATGQLWGNPVYNWDRLVETEFAWWVERFRATLQYVDVVRVDHFRGFEAYWRVPASEETAMNGEWVPTPGVEFFETLQAKLGDLPMFAEDLGIITPEVEELRDRFNFPGMRILLFAFGGDPSSPYLPHNYIENAVVYTGTHDNDTTVGWLQQISAADRKFLHQYLGLPESTEVTEMNWALIRIALASVANSVIIPLQDLLDLDNQSRMNDPSVSAGNWRWRYASADLLTPELGQRLLQLTKLYSRST
ncbi:MAG: 4-alpha-glucanotransferase [Thermosynechococcaceae cyanobacterium]